MTWIRTEEEVNAMIEDMKNRNNGKYITQGVTFNKKCPRQMDLLKKALMSSASFSGLGKEMLALRFREGDDHHFQSLSEPSIESKTKPKNLGNFT